MYHIELDFVVIGHESTQILEEHLEHVLGFLLEDGRVIDPDFAAELATGDVSFSMEMEADEESEAFATAVNAMRAAIHAAEGCTAGWEAHFRGTQSVIRRDPIPA